MNELPRGPRDEQRIYVESGGSAYVTWHGNMHIRGGHPVYWLESFPRRAVSPAPRDDELAWLMAWRDDPAPGISVILVHGPGGQGQSRLAGQFAADSAGQGWTVWAGQHVSDPATPLAAAPGRAGNEVVLVVERAGGWPADDLQLLLQNPLLRAPRRVRVVLMSEPAEGWWPALRHRLGKAGIAVGGTLVSRPR
jgi:hypothetical protein